MILQIRIKKETFSNFKFKHQMIKVLSIFLFSFLIHCCIADDEITNLPGLKDSINFKQYAGYVPVTGHKQLFYWITEREKDPENDPIILWLQGLFYLVFNTNNLQVDQDAVDYLLYFWNLVPFK